MAKLDKEAAAQAYRNGMSSMKTRRYFQARSQFASIVESFPKAAEAWFQMGLIDKTLGRPLSSAQNFERALSVKPEQYEILRELEIMARAVGKPDYAVRLNQRMARLRPKETGPKLNEGLAHQQNGDFDAAERVFRKAERQVPQLGSLYRIWFHGRTFRSAGDKVLRRALDVWKADKLDSKESMNLAFALAKAMEDLGEKEKFFHFLRCGNDLGKSMYPFDRDARHRDTDACLSASSKKDIARVGKTEFAPIFIVGTPRSGTTLIERILAAHPLVSAGGEISQASFLHAVFFIENGVVTPLHANSQDMFDRFARQYEASARENAQSDGDIITDKSMQMHRLMGWLYAAFPRAKFIVLRRDPCDVALSIYKSFFEAGTHTYSHDFANIAAILHDFDRCIAFWKERMDFAEFSYDDLTSAPEEQSRALVEAAGLEWDDACLEFHKRKSSVQTLSLAQVRQPIYKSSSGGWRKYEAQMKPFLDAWESYQ